MASLFTDFLPLLGQDGNMPARSPRKMPELAALAHEAIAGTVRAQVLRQLLRSPNNTASRTALVVGEYEVLIDPMDELSCDSCQ